SPRPSKAELQPIVQWLRGELLAADQKSQVPAGSIVLRRMNRLQYEKTVRDLLNIEIDFKDRLPTGSRGVGFDNIGQALGLSSAQIEAYLEAADAALDAAIVTKPRPVTVKQRLRGIEVFGDFSTRSHGSLLDLEEAAVSFGPQHFYASRDSV